MEIVYRKLADLRPNPKNPRRVEPEAVDALAESIKANPQFFEARPVLLSDRTGELVIIAGERRSEAGRLLKMEKVPTILLSGLTEEQEDEIMVRDNTHAGKWEGTKLSELMETWGKEKVYGWAQNVTWQKERGWDNDNEMPEDLDAEPKNKPFVLRITFPSADVMTKFVQKYKNEIESEYGGIVSETGGEL